MQQAKLKIASLLKELGFDLDDPFTKEAPQGLLDFLQKAAIALPKPQLTLLPLSSCCDTIVFRDLPFYSYCAHHLLPMEGKISIAFSPSKNILGLGSLKRIVEYIASRPQLQERLTQEIANYISNALEPLGLAVYVKATHSCTHASQGGWQTLETWAFKGSFSISSHPFQ